MKFSLQDVKDSWNSEADEYNQWPTLDEDEIFELTKNFVLDHYKELLKKYIDHVREVEGVTFLDDFIVISRFTAEELQELRVLAGGHNEDISFQGEQT